MKSLGPSPRVILQRPFVSFLILSLIGELVVCATISPQKHSLPISPSSSTRSLLVTTQPNAIVWIDDIRRGQTDASGKLEIKNVSAGAHTLRVRAIGFKESTTPLLAGKRNVPLKLFSTCVSSRACGTRARLARSE